MFQAMASIGPNTVNAMLRPRPLLTGVGVLVATALGVYKLAGAESSYTPATYFVDCTNGVNGAAGAHSAFRTIQEACRAVRPGDQVIVRDGVYTAPPGYSLVDVIKGGRVSRPVTFQAEHRGRAILCGGTNSIRNCFVIEAHVSHVKISGFCMSGFLSAGVTIGDASTNIEISANDIGFIGRTCTDTPYGLDGIYVSPNSSGVLVDKNVIHDIGRFAPGENGCNPSTTYYANHDHGVYVNGVNGITIINNVFFNNHSGWGVHFYSGSGTFSSHILVANNTFAFANPYRVGQVVLTSPGVVNATFENNLFFAPKTAGLNVDPSSAFTNVTVNNNLVSVAKLASSMPPNVSFTNNLINADPLLVDPQRHDFHLQRLSPAADGGRVIPQVTDNFDGYPRSTNTGAYSIGAY